MGPGSGTKRDVTVQRSRLGKFAMKIRRFIALACNGISAVKLVRIGGTAVMQYGDEAMGVSDHMLMLRRRAVASAIARGAKGKELDLLAMGEDNGRSLIDPAYRAHSAPISRWVEAVWGGWIPLHTMENAAARARSRLAAAKRPRAAVSGPAAATVATAARIGWRLQGADTLVSDTGRLFDLSLDPPVTRDEVHKAVRRWRWGRNVDKHPSLAQGDADGEKALKPIKALLSDRARHGGWGRGQQAALRSAVVNGQWPQIRLHAAGFIEDPACQYCLHAASNEGMVAPAGSLLHRVTNCPLVAAIVRGAIGVAWHHFRARRREARRALGVDGDDAGDDPMAVVQQTRYSESERHWRHRQGDCQQDDGNDTAADVHRLACVGPPRCNGDAERAHADVEHHAKIPEGTTASPHGAETSRTKIGCGGGVTWGNRKGWMRPLLRIAGYTARQATLEVVATVGRARSRTAIVLA